MGYELDGRGIGVQFPAGARDIYFLHSVQTKFGAHPDYYTMGIRGVFLPDKAAGVKVTIHIHLAPRSGMTELYLHSPLHGAYGFYLNHLNGRRVGNTNK
jgi:hypothetical protein